MNQAPDGLSQLCREAGVATRWHDGEGREHVPPKDALRAILRAIGIETERDADDARALAALEAERELELVPPVHVAAPDTASEIRWRVQGAAPAHVRIEAEDGDVIELDVAAGDSDDGAERSVWLPPLPAGRHRARIAWGDRSATCTLLVAPQRAFAGEPGQKAGIFAPIFTLGDVDACSPGTFTDLEAFTERVTSLGIDIVATLPLLPTFDDDPSPYAPVSRSFWNERLVDTAALPGAGDGILEPQQLADRFFEAGGASDPSFAAWLSRTPRAAAFARFRAACARRPGGRPSPGEEAAVLASRETLSDPHARLALFLQWAAEVAMERTAARAASHGGMLALDLPVGVHPDGFDRMAEPALFADGVSIGAPPDTFFHAGQDWGLPPLRPRASRADGHGGFARAIRHHARHAGLLRIDHVMSLHRLFFVPRGFGPAEGSYVTYPADELWSVVTLEAERARCVIVGEDLGTVPDEVRETMAGRGALRSWVWLFEAGAESEAPRGAEPPEPCSATLSTHDTPTFAGFLHGHDVALRERFGQLDAEEASRQLGERRELVARVRRRFGDAAAEPDDASLLGAVLAWLAASRARVVTVALDDILLVEESINVPGTTSERANWRRRHGRSMADVLDDPAVIDALALLSRRGRHPSGRS